MVKITSLITGFGQFLRGYIRHRRFLRALKQCERINLADARRHIVINIGGKPLILCKADFRTMRLKGVFRREATWGMLMQHQITLENV